MKNSKLVVIAMSLLMTLSISSFSQKSGEQRIRTGERSEMRQDRMDRIPDLSVDQKEKIRGYRMENQKQLLPLKNEIDEKKARLKTLTTADNTDMKSINAMIEEIGELKTEIAKLRAATHQKVRAELTEDQRLFVDSQAGKRQRMRRVRRMQNGR